MGNLILQPISRQGTILMTGANEESLKVKITLNEIHRK
jgi:hypothetical protein